VSSQSDLTSPPRTTQALHLQPHDKAILFNIAMIQQKAAEMLVSLNVERRTLAELEDGFKHAAHAQTFVLRPIVLFAMPILT
jgi:hypothetical protein